MQEASTGRSLQASVHRHPLAVGLAPHDRTRYVRAVCVSPPVPATGRRRTRRPPRPWPTPGPARR